jgi:outer membrane receptor for ferrienterochelin and colicin
MAGLLLVAVIRTMYTNPSVSIQCRRIIVQCATANRQLYEVYAAKIASVITAKEVHQEMWRDLAPLLREVTTGIIGSI